MPVILSDVYDDNRFNPEIDNPTHENDIRSMLTVPVQCKSDISEHFMQIYII